MTGFDTTVMSAIDPRLQIGEDKMDHRQVFLRLFGITPECERIVFVANFAKAVIALPSVSTNDGASGYIVLDECCERFGVAARKRNINLFDAGDNTEPEAPCISEFLSRNAAFVGIFPFRATILGVLTRPHLDGANYGC